MIPTAIDEHTNAPAVCVLRADQYSRVKMRSGHVIRTKHYCLPSGAVYAYLPISWFVSFTGGDLTLTQAFHEDFIVYPNMSDKQLRTISYSIKESCFYHNPPTNGGTCNHASCKKIREQITITNAHQFISECIRGEVTKQIRPITLYNTNLDGLVPEMGVTVEDDPKNNRMNVYISGTLLQGLNVLPTNINTGEDVYDLPNVSLLEGRAPSIISMILKGTNAIINCAFDCTFQKSLVTYLKTTYIPKEVNLYACSVGIEDFKVQSYPTREMAEKLMRLFAKANNLSEAVMMPKFENQDYTEYFEVEENLGKSIKEIKRALALKVRNEAANGSAKFRHDTARYYGWIGTLENINSFKYDLENRFKLFTVYGDGCTHGCQMGIYTSKVMAITRQMVESIKRMPWFSHYGERQFVYLKPNAYEPMVLERLFKVLDNCTINRYIFNDSLSNEQFSGLYHSCYDPLSPQSPDNKPFGLDWYNYMTNHGRGSPSFGFEVVVDDFFAFRARMVEARTETNIPWVKNPWHTSSNLNELQDNIKLFWQQEPPASLIITTQELTPPSHDDDVESSVSVGGDLWNDFLNNETVDSQLLAKLKRKLAAIESTSIASDVNESKKKKAE